MYGPVPKTADKDTDGRGYVFAMWPFHYSEIYTSASGPTSQYRDPSTFPCFKQTDGGDGKPPPCPANTGDMMSVPNYEYDIEIPANSPQFATNHDQWKKHLTWSTMRRQHVDERPRQLRPGFGRVGDPRRRHRRRRCSGALRRRRSSCRAACTILMASRSSS